MADLFKGYIKSKGKEPLGSIYKPSDWLEAPPENHDYVGVLRNEYVQLDFDNANEAETILKIVNDLKLKCDILKTTRGVHLYFLNDGTFKSNKVHDFNALGFTVDIGVGSVGRCVPLVVTKEIEQVRIINGEEVISTTNRVIKREWLQTYSDLDVAPAFLRTIGKKDYELRNSTTRNQTLFNYILTLQSNNFNRDEIRRTIRLINKYVLREPLTDKEIDSITRDESFSEELFFDKNKFLHDRFGNYMLANCNIIRIDGNINIYTEEELYSNDPLEFEKQMLAKIPCLRDSQRKEVYKYINIKCAKTGEFANPKYIGLKKEILDIQTLEKRPYSPNIIINNKIDYSYNPSAYHAEMDKTLDKVCCGDKQIRNLFEEMIGYTLYRKNNMQVCFILTGEGSNGKSTLLNCIKKLLGKKNYTSLDLRELEETFKPAELYNKLANIGDDISAKYLENSSVFKKVVTGESFMVMRKYADPFQMECYATQIFCANELPQVHDKSDGFSRRIVIVPFNAKFKTSDPDYDPFIEDKLLSDESMNYLLKLAVGGLQRVLKRKSFTKSAVGEEEKSDFMKMNNNVIEWLESEPSVENEAVNEVYMIYQVWCANNGCSPVKKLNLSKEIKKQLGLVSKIKTIEGKSVRVYTKEDEEIKLCSGLISK